MTFRTRRLDGKFNWGFVLMAALIVAFWAGVYIWLDLR
jgi:hypothetical protein